MSKILQMTEKIVEMFSADSRLSSVKTIDFGALPEPVSFREFPLLFLSIRYTRHPEVRAARGLGSSYSIEVHYSITIYTYIVKEGYKEAFLEALSIYENLISVCHDNKLWDGLAYNSEVAEENVEWGVVPWGDLADEYAFGINVPLSVYMIGGD